LSSEGDGETSNEQRFSHESDFLKYMEENNKESDYEQLHIEAISFIEQV